MPRIFCWPEDMDEFYVIVLCMCEEWFILLFNSQVLMHFIHVPLHPVYKRLYLNKESISMRSDDGEGPGSALPGPFIHTTLGSQEG